LTIYLVAFTILSKILMETKSVPVTNVTPECDFAVLDRLMSQKPNASYSVIESLLLSLTTKHLNG